MKIDKTTWQELIKLFEKIVVVSISSLVAGIIVRFLDKDQGERIIVFSLLGIGIFITLSLAAHFFKSIQKK